MNSHFSELSLDGDVTDTTVSGALASRISYLTSKRDILIKQHETAIERAYLDFEADMKAASDEATLVRKGLSFEGGLRHFDIARKSLSLTRQRLQKLIDRGRIRQAGEYLSIADINAFVEERKARPAGGRPDQKQLEVRYSLLASARGLTVSTVREQMENISNPSPTE